MKRLQLCGGGPHIRGKLVRITRRNTSKNTVLPFKTTFSAAFCTAISTAMWWKWCRRIYQHAEIEYS